MYYIGICIVLLFTLLPFAVSVFRWKELDLPSRIFAILLGCVFTVECLATYTAIRYRNNIEVYNVAGWLQLVLVCLYFNYSISCFRKWHIGLYLAAASVVLGFLNTLYLEPVGEINTFSLTYQAILVVFLGIMLFTELLLQEGYVNAYKSVHFWLVLILVLFNSLTLVNYSLYDYLALELSERAYLLTVYIWFCGLLTNIGFTLVFIFYHRLKPVYGK